MTGWMNIAMPKMKIPNSPSDDVWPQEPSLIKDVYDDQSLVDTHQRMSNLMGVIYDRDSEYRRSGGFIEYRTSEGTVTPKDTEFYSLEVSRKIRKSRTVRKGGRSTRPKFIRRPMPDPKVSITANVTGQAVQNSKVTKTASGRLVRAVRAAKEPSVPHQAVQTGQAFKRGTAAKQNAALPSDWPANVPPGTNPKQGINNHNQPFPCYIDNCWKGYRNQSLLDRHWKENHNYIPRKNAEDGGKGTKNPQKPEPKGGKVAKKSQAPEAKYGGKGSKKPQEPEAKGGKAAKESEAKKCGKGSKKSHEPKPEDDYEPEHSEDEGKEAKNSQGPEPKGRKAAKQSPEPAPKEGGKDSKKLQQPEPKGGKTAKQSQTPETKNGGKGPKRPQESEPKDGKAAKEPEAKDGGKRIKITLKISQTLEAKNGGKGIKISQTPEAKNGGGGSATFQTPESGGGGKGSKRSHEFEPEISKKRAKQFKEPESEDDYEPEPTEPVPESGGKIFMRSQGLKSEDGGKEAKKSQEPKPASSMKRARQSDPEDDYQPGPNSYIPPTKKSKLTRRQVKASLAYTFQCLNKKCLKTFGALAFLNDHMVQTHHQKKYTSETWTAAVAAKEKAATAAKKKKVRRSFGMDGADEYDDEEVVVAEYGDDDGIYEYDTDEDGVDEGVGEGVGEEGVEDHYYQSAATLPVFSSGGHTFV